MWAASAVYICLGFVLSLRNFFFILYICYIYINIYKGQIDFPKHSVWIIVVRVQ